MSFITTDKVCNSVLFAAYCYFIVFGAVAEYFFWDEFTTRFNFVAVDYLIYTREVVGNIYESYPLIPLLASIAVVSIGAAFWMYKRPSSKFSPSKRLRLSFIAVVIAASTLSYFVVDIKWSEKGSNVIQNELSKNGTYSIFSCFLNNKLPYDQFYISDSQNETLRTVRELVASTGDEFLSDSFGLVRQVSYPENEIKKNIVVIMVESLSAEFLNTFGNLQNLTPEIDSLAKKSLLFTNLRATGTRTVYGLSALTLSIPPVPGNAISRQSENENLFSLGNVLRSKGYDCKFIYGGFGYFDNMNYFFSKNGYDIVDRSDLKSDEIHFSNIWGVCDEDLFSRAIAEGQKSFESGRPFFFTVMTTSITVRLLTLKIRLISLLEQVD